jgi:CxxC-x17-CxxC domain-containing protein
MDFVDRILTCTDCGGQFVFTAGEQFFFQDKQFKNDPKRCKPCKSRRGAQAAGATTGNGLAAAGISRTETRTICSECGIETTVPFKPTQGRPVLCRQCYKNKMAAAPAAEQTVPASAPAVQPVAASAKLPPAPASAPHAAHRQPPQPEYAASDVSLAI